ncbi:TylF/MycF/NovP-related O-methyltransferase [uncultured Paraglaciecola sp.]|uniref:TylF/MycF/NovP-related O-methyltransferase n=1 Tax=uncultured Paraglaciecola sp. TaxID=1765024 RepID=UPI00262AF724|nr:TylF/MycF/NovP-related O-methyltransferase [uncultured Paraglaciecola sp.]
MKLGQIFEKYSSFSMIKEGKYIENLQLIREFSHISGAVVECGVWKGGMIAGVAEILGCDRAYYLFDSFEGLPEAQTIDGDAAIKWQQDTESPIYFDNCAAPIEESKKAMLLSGATKTYFIKGWFSDTLPSQSIEGGIAILRLDGDWYESTMDVLENLFTQVNPGGIIIIDDYFIWDGCAKAVHDFLSKNSCVERIRQYKNVCYLIKK